MPLPVLRTTATRFALTAGVSAFGAFALLAVAALIEGRGPRPAIVAAVVSPLAALLGMAWTFGAWRTARGDVALAALGVRRGAVAAWLLLLSIPILALAPGPPARSSPISISPGSVHAQTRHGAVQWTWSEASIDRRTADGDVARLPIHPRPTGRLAPVEARSRWWGLAVRLGLAALLLLGLAAGSTPGPARMIGGVAVAFTLGHLVVRLL